MTPRWRAALLNLALAAMGFGVALSIGEVAVRVASRSRKGGKEQQERNRYTEFDPVLGWRKTPGASVVYDRREYHVEYRLNSLGLRGAERPYAKPAGVARVMALGDSFVEGFMVDEPRTITGRLEALLGQRGCKAEVLNGGTVGYSTDQEYLFFRDEGSKYGSDVVVLFVYHNDIPYLVLDRYLGYPKPVLSFDAQPPVVSNQPVPRYEPPAAAAPAEGPPPTSYLLEFVKTRVEFLSAPAYNRLARLGVWEPLRRLPMNDELRLFKVPEWGHLRPAWSAFAWTLETLAKAVASTGGRLVVAYVPSRMEVTPRVWEYTKARYGLDDQSFDRKVVAARVRYIAGRLKIPVLDLTTPLQKADSLLKSTYFETDSHWNARGQDVAAAAVAQFLVSAGAVPGCR